MSNIPIFTGTKQQILETINTRLYSNRQKFSKKHSRPINIPAYSLLVTLNSEMLVYAHHHARFQNTLNSSWLCTADSVGIQIWRVLTKKPVPPRITGIILTEGLIDLSVKRGYTIGFIGGRSESAYKLCQKYSKQYNKLKTWADAGPQIVIDEQLHDAIPISRKLLLRIRQWAEKKADFSINLNNNHTIQDHLQQTDILLVGFGHPKQEYFIRYLNNEYRRVNQSDTTTKIAVGVGGTFDELIGLVPRCPKWIETMGMKWLFRLFVQPWRWKRQLSLIQFFWLILTRQI